MTSYQYKQSTEQYALFKNKVDLLKDFSQKLILSVLSNLFRNLRTHCINECHTLQTNLKINLQNNTKLLRKRSLLKIIHC
jgi:hypothetical protein